MPEVGMKGKTRASQPWKNTTRQMTGKITRECPKCKAQPGWRCMRKTADYKEHEGYMVRIKSFHKER